MKKIARPNIILSVIIFFLFSIGVLILATASAPYSISRGLPAEYLIKNQLLHGVLFGLIFGVIAYKMPMSFFKKYSLPIFIFAYICMWLVFVPGLSRTEYGATRWIGIGSVGFQPSEALKLATIIYISALMSSARQHKEKFTGLLIALGMIGLVLVCQSNLSTLIIISSLALIIFFISGTPKKYNFLMWGGSALLFFCLMVFKSYRSDRWQTFLNPENDPLGKGYHISQALISIGSGGLIGSGLGLSEQKFGFVPESISDSIFTIYAAETGFIGSIFLIGLFFSFVFMSYRLAKQATDPFQSFVAVGIGSWITIQAFVNVAAMTGLAPLSGTPLPFLTYGSSHIIMELIACGLLLNISKK
ncbi:MAG: FtsW/RodA/SpoVE family cell cycle protein [Candidatus Pacebacteria bacterium]|nr:FtsW/RodA/SpoVE family cell cycle protein [Candidatus Paceibacterota bacterium]